jgi:hypothetical protein
LGDYKRENQQYLWFVHFLYRFYPTEIQQAQGEMMVSQIPIQGEIIQSGPSNDVPRVEYGVKTMIESALLGTREEYL